MSDSNNDTHEENLLDKIVGLFQSEPQSIDELSDVLEEASHRKIINNDSLDMIKGILEMTDLRIRDIMIPRSSMVSIKAESDLKEVLEIVTTTAHSRYPVINEGNDSNETEYGLLLAKDLIPLLYRSDQEFDLSKITRPAMIVPEGKRVNLLLKDFKKNRYHMAIVIDEFNSLAGLVTIEDVLECIVGKIGNEYGIQADSDIREAAHNVYLVKGMTSISDFNEFFQTDIENDDVETMAGVVISILGHVPETGEQVSIKNFNIKVLNVDRRRINLLQVKVNTSDGEKKKEDNAHDDNSPE
ncbi:MAG: HlyC/CorC family transporter [Succinivibrionaceae bacterium]